MTVQVVFHIDENAKWNLLLRNIRNLCREYDPKASRIEVVANAEAVKFYASPANVDEAENLRELAGKGVRVAACANALRGMGIAAEKLPPFVEVVPSGVGELIRRQAEGYAYIKP